MNKEEITFDIPNYAIPREIKDICKECENNIHCQNKGCAFRSLGNEYCDVVLNATKLYLKLQQENKQLKERIDKAIEYIESYKSDYSPYELSDYNVRQILEIIGGKE